MKKKILFSCLLSSLFSAAYGADWPVIAKAPNHGFVHINKDSITDDFPYRKAWFLWSYLSPQKPTASSGLKPYKSFMQSAYFNCPTRKAAIIQTQYFSDSAGLGEVVYGIAYQPAPNMFFDVVPGSIQETMMAAVCSTEKGQ